METKWYAMTSHVIAYRSTELLFGTHTFNFNCFFDDFNCIFTQIRCLSRLLDMHSTPPQLFNPVGILTTTYLSKILIGRYMYIHVRQLRESIAIVLITAFVKLFKHINWSPMDKVIFKRSYHMRFWYLLHCQATKAPGQTWGELLWKVMH